MNAVLTALLKVTPSTLPHVKLSAADSGSNSGSLGRSVVSFWAKMWLTSGASAGCDGACSCWKISTSADSSAPDGSTIAPSDTFALVSTRVRVSAGHTTLSPPSFGPCTWAAKAAPLTAADFVADARAVVVCELCEVSKDGGGEEDEGNEDSERGKDKEDSTGAELKEETPERLVLRMLLFLRVLL